MGAAEGSAIRKCFIFTGDRVRFNTDHKAKMHCTRLEQKPLITALSCTHGGGKYTDISCQYGGYLIDDDFANVSGTEGERVFDVSYIRKSRV